jgi:hypothetical protein
MATHPRLGEHSFDHILQRLLQKKRVLMRQMMCPPVADRDISEMFDAAVA